MGLFKDLRKLTQQANDLSSRHSPVDQLKQAKAAMAHGTELLGAMNAAGGPSAPASANAVDAVATVVSVRQTGAWMNHNPVCEIELLVMMPSGVPVPVTVRPVVQMIHLVRVQPGARLPIKVDPADAASASIDWSAPPPT